MALQCSYNVIDTFNVLLKSFNKVFFIFLYSFFISFAVFLGFVEPLFKFRHKNEKQFTQRNVWHKRVKNQLTASFAAVEHIVFNILESSRHIFDYLSILELLNKLVLTIFESRANISGMFLYDDNILLRNISLVTNSR